MERTSDYLTKWSQTEKYKYHMPITYMCNLFEKMCKWTYLRNRNELKNIENKLMAPHRKHHGALFLSDLFSLPLRLHHSLDIHWKKAFALLFSLPGMLFLQVTLWVGSFLHLVFAQNPLPLHLQTSSPLSIAFIISYLVYSFIKCVSACPLC